MVFLIMGAVLLEVQLSFSIDFLAVACVYITLRRGRKVSGIVCIAGGLLENMISGGPLGLRSMALMVGCWMIGLITHLVYKEHLSTKYVCVLLGTLIAILLEWLGLHFVDQMYWTGLSLGQVLIPVAFWTACCSLFLMPLCDRVYGAGNERYFVT